MPFKRSWGKFKVPLMFDWCLDDEFGSASFDLQHLTFWIEFTGHSSLAYDKWEWKIHHWLMNSTQHLLPSPRRLSTVVCQPGIMASWGCRQSLVQEVEHNGSVTYDTSMTWLIMHGQMYFIVWTNIVILSRQKRKRKPRWHPWHDSRKDPLNWYEPSSGTISQWSRHLWCELLWLHPGGSDRAAWQFF